MSEIKLIHWDCLKVMDEMIFAWVKVDAIITDPPYLVTKKWSVWTTWGMMATKQTMKWKIFNHNDIDISIWLPKAIMLLKDNSQIYIMTNHKNLHHFLDVAKQNKLDFIKSLVRVKDNKIMWRYYMSQFEYILFFRKGKVPRINNCWTSDVLNFQNKKMKDDSNKNLHDTEKPVWLMEVLVWNSVIDWQVVLDPFMWIWATGVACKNLNRNFIWIEIDDKYFEIAKNRIEWI